MTDLGQFHPSANAAAEMTDVDEFSSALFDRGCAARLAPEEFDTLLRSVELVVQSGAFSVTRLGLALRLGPDSAERMRDVLEALGVIGHGLPNAAREVTVDPHDLPIMLAALRAYRDSRLASAA